MDKVNSELIRYIEDNVFPIYEKNEEGHGIEHIKYVIRRSLDFADTVADINYDMVYVIAAYHDIGHHIDPKRHETVSASMLREDINLKRFFDEDTIEVMSEAVEDHRASLEKEPRSIYGKIVSSADRNTTIDELLRRTYTYRVGGSGYELYLDEIIEESRQHLIDKFGYTGYAKDKMYFDDEEYDKFLKEISTLCSDKVKFRKKYQEVNGINDVYQNMLYLYDLISKKHPDIIFDDLVYYVYIKLDTDKSFEEVWNTLAEKNNVSKRIF